MAAPEMGWEEGGLVLEPVPSLHRPSAGALEAQGTPCWSYMAARHRDTVLALHSCGHRGCNNGPAWHQDMGDATLTLHRSGDMGEAVPALLSTRTQGTPTLGQLRKKPGRNTPVQPGAGDTVPAPHSSWTMGVPTSGGHQGKDWGHGGGGAACSIPETRCRVGAPRGPCLSPGTAPGPASPARQGLKPAAASAP